MIKSDYQAYIDNTDIWWAPGNTVSKYLMNSGVEESIYPILLNCHNIGKSKSQKYQVSLKSGSIMYIGHAVYYSNLKINK